MGIVIWLSEKEGTWVIVSTFIPMLAEGALTWAEAFHSHSTNFGQLISSGETFIPVSCKTLTYILLPLVFILNQCASFVCCLVLLISSAIQWYIKHKANLCVVILESKQVTPTFKKWIREDVNVIYLSSFGMCACWHVRYTRPECGKLLYGCLNFIICNWAELPRFSRMYI